MVQIPHNDDYRDMLLALRNAGVEYMIIGGYALAVHGFLRATKDIDIWVHPTEDNAERLWTALVDFGAPLDHISPSDFAKPGIVLQIGVAPVRIDLITKVDGVDFAAAWEEKIESELFEVPTQVIGRDSFISNKLASGREQDLRDVEMIRKLEDEHD